MKLPNLDDPTVGKFLQVATHELPTEQPSTSDRDEREFIRMRGDILNRPGLRGADGSLWAGAAIAASQIWPSCSSPSPCRVNTR